MSDVWYVSYGSNMCSGRLACYIEGGCPPGGAVSYPGARDATVPRRTAAVDLPGRVYFAGDSPVWGGGVAFYDHVEPGPTPARAYLVSAEQFADIAAQEMHRIPDPDDPLEEVILGGRQPGLDDGRHIAGPGEYETLIEVGRLEGLPMLTFTAPHGFTHVPHTQPSKPYLTMLAEGLRESRGWGDEEIATYFARVTVE